MDDFIEKLRQQPDLQVYEMDTCWEIKFVHKAVYTFVITIPKSVFEWFVSLYIDESQEEWSDWVEWYEGGEITEQNLKNYYKADIWHFIEKLRQASEFRLEIDPGFKFLGKEFFKTKFLEGKFHGNWEKIYAGSLPEDFTLH